MVKLRLPWLQEPRMFSFFCVKTMANFCTGTWKLRENMRCIGGGEVITDINTLLLTTAKKVSQDFINVP